MGNPQPTSPVVGQPTVLRTSHYTKYLGTYGKYCKSKGT